MNRTRIRLRIDEVCVSGLSPGDAQRLVDRLEAELAALAPALATARHAQPRGRVDAGSVRHDARVDRVAAPLARAIVKAVCR